MKNNMYLNNLSVVICGDCKLISLKRNAGGVLACNSLTNRSLNPVSSELPPVSITFDISCDRISASHKWIEFDTRKAAPQIDDLPSINVGLKMGSGMRKRETPNDLRKPVGNSYSSWGRRAASSSRNGPSEKKYF